MATGRRYSAHGAQEKYDACLKPPAYSQSAKPEYVEQTQELMQQIIRLLVRCGVKARGAAIREYLTRRSRFVLSGRARRYRTP